MAKIMTSLAVLAMVWMIKFGWNFVAVEPYDYDEMDTSWVAEQSEWVAAEVGAGAAAPAHGWLGQARHGTFEADPAAMQALIDEFAAGGAEQVWMVGIEEFGEARISDTIAVELPEGGYARERIFEIEAAFWEGDGTPDIGQQFLVVSFD